MRPAPCGPRSVTTQLVRRARRRPGHRHHRAHGDGRVGAFPRVVRVPARAACLLVRRAGRRGRRRRGRRGGRRRGRTGFRPCRLRPGGGGGRIGPSTRAQRTRPRRPWSRSSAVRPEPWSQCRSRRRSRLGPRRHQRRSAGCRRAGGWAAPPPSTRRRRTSDVVERRTAAAPHLRGPPELRPSSGGQRDGEAVVRRCAARYGRRNANANFPEAVSPDSLEAKHEFPRCPRWPRPRPPAPDP